MYHKTWEKSNEYELMYWRKCWNVREAILNYLTLDKESEDGIYTMNNVDLFFIVTFTLELVYGKNNWVDGYGSSIWTWEEMGKHYKKEQKYAKRVAKLLAKKNPESYEIIFYDSY